MSWPTRASVVQYPSAASTSALPTKVRCLYPPPQSPAAAAAVMHLQTQTDCLPAAGAQRRAAAEVVEVVAMAAVAVSAAAAAAAAAAEVAGSAALPLTLAPCCSRRWALWGLRLQTDRSCPPHRPVASTCSRPCSSCTP